VSEQLALAVEARDTALAAVEARSDSIDVAVIDQAIRATGEQLGEFSANDVRDKLPQLNSRAQIGPRFRVAALRGDLEHLGFVRSTSPSTHTSPIALWRFVRWTG